MSRRPTAGRRLADSGSLPFVGALHSKSHTSPLLSIGLLVVGALLIIGYIYHGSGGRNGDIGSLNRLDGGVLGTQEVQRLIPILKKAYGDSMRKVLHVGPDTCSVVSQLLKEEDKEAWGVEPYELDEPDSNCKSLLRKGVVRVADIKFPLPYGPKSFSLVIVSDALDYLSPKYLNKTVPELARVSADGLVILSEEGGMLNELLYENKSLQHYHGAAMVSNQQAGTPSVVVHLYFVKAKLRSSSWWTRFFTQTSLEENESAIKEFERTAAKNSYKSACQVFHLKPLL